MPWEGRRNHPPTASSSVQSAGAEALKILWLLEGKLDVWMAGWIGLPFLNPLWSPTRFEDNEPAGQESLRPSPPLLRFNQHCSLEVRWFKQCCRDPPLFIFYSLSRELGRVWGVTRRLVLHSPSVGLHWIDRPFYLR